MCIKKFAFYCKSSHKWKGLVNLGGQLEECDEKGHGKRASKSLVFMLVLMEVSKHLSRII